MSLEEYYRNSYRKRMKHVRSMALIQIAFAIAIMTIVLVRTWSGIYEDARNTTYQAQSRMGDIVEGYESAFQAILIPVRQEIAKNPSPEELQTWLYSKEEEFSQAVGEEAYDGFALTYQGQYLHSWNYGNYSDYDATTRPWYIAAQEANGEITIVPPYVTYLSEEGQETDSGILMTIALKENDDISYDLDLKLPKIMAILQGIEKLYPHEDIFIYNRNGEILSSSEASFFSHNVRLADNVISKGLVRVVSEDEQNIDKLRLESVDGSLYYVYFGGDKDGGILCIMVPAIEIFMRDFLLIIILCVALVGFVIYSYIVNKRSVIAFIEMNRRLMVIEDSEQKERLFVDTKKMKFSGNSTAKVSAKDGSYDSLYALIQHRMADPSELSRLEAFLSPKVVKNSVNRQYVMDKERFLMKMKDKDGVLRVKTIEMRKLCYLEDKTPMLEIAMLDAAESVDLLKQALEEAKLLKEEKEEEYNRYMGYICMAEDGVEELNIKEHTITRYFVKDGVLASHTISYPSMPFELFHEEDREKAHELYDEDKLLVLCREKRASYAELRMKWNDASEYHWCNVLVLGMPITEKAPFNVLILIKDTNETKLKEIEQRQALEDAFRMAEQGSEAKGSFLSNMSHEIRTPLNAIIGYLTIASDEDATPEKKDYCIENCQTASKHLLQIINDVLDMSSIESGKLKIANEDFDLKKELSDITSIFYQNAKMKNIHFRTHIDALTEEWVVGDQLRLNQVLMNLLSNAVKFTPEDGTVELSTKQLRKDSKQVYMQFSVSDTGIGMSPEYMSRIFHPFEQENAGTAKRFGGSGLGLSITNNLVGLMGGKIDVKSDQGKGTTFQVTMYFGLSKHSPAVKQPADYAHVHVLVVDDQENECSYIKMMLERCGTSVDTVTSGKMALRRLKTRRGSEFQYDLCIVDYNMPEMDGVEVTRRIREEVGDNVPVIIATAYDVSEFRDEALAAGANKIVSKPLFQSTLFDLLVTSFGSYHPEASAQTKTYEDLTGVHVLLAEDNPMNMDIAVTILEKAGVTVDKARNGQEAVDVFLSKPEHTYNLILMDVQMPVMDGYEATQTIRKSSHPEAKTIPIIAMTANAFAEDVNQALANGMNAHISKPISYDKLFEMLAKYSTPKD